MTVRHVRWIALVATCTALAAAADGAGSTVPPAATVQPSGHSHPKGKLPSQYTLEQQPALRASLPFEDQRDFQESKRGFVAAPPYRQIKNEAGDVVWNMAAYDFLLEGKDFASVHPSLQRQAVLNMGYGLYEVLPGRIWQVRGVVEQAIGKMASSGTTGLIAPTRSIAGDIEELTVDGVRMTFQNPPGTGAPAEMNTWFPQFKVFWVAENVTATVHSIYTPRGALIRDPMQWSKEINHALYLFGREADVLFSAHSYHGSEEHNSRAVINRYRGYWDGNPATPKNLLTDAFEQFGYQKESWSLRNSFLAAALELRAGVPSGILRERRAPTQSAAYRPTCGSITSPSCSIAARPRA